MITKNKTLSVNNIPASEKITSEVVEGDFETNDEPSHDIHDRDRPKFAIVPEPVSRKEKLASR